MTDTTWLTRQMQQVKNDMAQWPAWMLNTTPSAKIYYNTPEYHKLKIAYLKKELRKYGFKAVMIEESK